MRQFIKTAAISFAILLLFIGIAISIALWIVFTPEKLTPIVRKQAEKYIPYKTEIGDVELTFFSTFPQFGIKITDMAVFSSFEGAQSDTLMFVNELIGAVDVKALRQSNELHINKLLIKKCTVNAFIDSVGGSNFELLLTNKLETESNEPSELPFNFINLNNIELKDINLSYINLQTNMLALTRGLDGDIFGNITSEIINCDVDIIKSNISLSLNGDRYLDNLIFSIKSQANILPSLQKISFAETLIGLNSLELSLAGSIQNDTINKKIISDIDYSFQNWDIKDVIELVPPKFLASLDGIVVTKGQFSSTGTIAGDYGENMMPIFDMHLLVNNTDVDYTAFPTPLNSVAGDFHIYTDLKCSNLSFVKINNLEAKTNNSSIQTSGEVNNIYTDAHLKLSTNAKIFANEFKDLVPADLKLLVKGNINGEFKTEFTLSQLKNQQIELMRLSGTASLVGFELTYDSLSVQTNSSKLNFVLPNRSATGNTGFAKVGLSSDRLKAQKINGFITNLTNAKIEAEMSDPRDTTRIPDIKSTFDLDFLVFETDTLGVTISKPIGQFQLWPVSERVLEPGIKLTYNSGKIESYFGENLASVSRVRINTQIINDKSRKDIFRKWLATGYIDLQEADLTLHALGVPMVVPDLKMDFTPEVFKIKESRMKIDHSDFNLSGVLSNVLSYFRGDSILRGEFRFDSQFTDILEILNLTSGIGAEEVVKNPSKERSSTYMVPKGVDFILNTNVSRASFGTDTATNINGSVRINDGILVLDGLTFTTPAARMQLTAMYRTPRKNHLFLGIDYHMFDVEIAEVLNLIPDIDSLMPMLRSFGGKGEFHMAFESYLDSAYNIKKSTLRGASSIKGQDLTLMDGETFSEIAKTLKFSKRTQNKVDSLSAEFTIFREEIDVYPFLIVMDRYKAVVAGRHNFDLSFNYHISVVESPLPIKLGVDVTGTMGNLKYSLAKARYAEFYRPASRRAVENKQLELRRIIREALIRNVRKEDE